VIAEADFPKKNATGFGKTKLFLPAKLSKFNILKSAGTKTEIVQ
jgi:hypothetical protein